MLKAMKLFLISILTLVLVAVIVVVVTAFQLRKTLTDDRPMSLPAVSVHPAKRPALVSRYNRLTDAWKEHRPISMSFTGDDINQLIAVVPELEKLRGKVFVRLEDGHAYVTTSIPLRDVSSRLENRYLNGEFKLEVYGSSDMDLTVEVLSATNSRGEPYPDWVLASVNEVLEKAHEQEEVQKLLLELREGLDRLHIVDDHVNLSTRF